MLKSRWGGESCSKLLFSPFFQHLCNYTNCFVPYSFLHLNISYFTQRVDRSFWWNLFSVFNSIIISRQGLRKHFLFKNCFLLLCFVIIYYILSDQSFDVIHKPFFIYSSSAPCQQFLSAFLVSAKVDQCTVSKQLIKALYRELIQI